MPLPENRLLGILPPPAADSTRFHSAISAPNLTDGTIQGVYNAATRVPSSAIETLNRVSTRIGAPSLSSGPAPIAMHMPAGGGGDPSPLVGSLPTVARAGIARAKVLANGFGARLHNLPKSF